MVRCIAIFLLFLCSTQAYTQEPTHYVIGKEEFDGVHLYSIIQDNDNNIWITSNKGLHFYNGVEYRFFTPKNAKSSSLFQLTKDNNGNIFCFNLNGQIFKMVNSQLQLYYTIPKKYLKDGISLAFNTKNDLLIRVYGVLLTISSEKKLLKVEKNKGYFLTKKNNTIYYLKYSKTTSYIVAFKNGKERIVLSYNHKKYPVIPYNTIYIINNNFYGFDYVKSTIFKMENNLVTKYKFPFLVKNNCKIYSDTQNLWFSDYQNGVYKVDYANVKNQQTNPEKWFKDYYISGVMRDNENNIWLLTFKKGIIIIPNTAIKSHSYQLKNSIFKGITKVDNKIFVSNSKGSVYEFVNNSLIKKRTFKNGVLEYFAPYKNNVTVTNTHVYKNNKVISSLSFCRKSLQIDNTIYTIDVRGLSKHNLHTIGAERLTNRRAHDLVYDKSSKKFWLSTNIGLIQYKNKIETPILQNNKPIYSSKLLNVENEIWATTREGIYILKNDSIHRILTTKNGLLTNQISNLKYEKPNVYLASQKGMQRYNTITKTFKNITKSDGLIKAISNFEVLNDTIYALNSDALVSFRFDNINNKVPKYKTKITKALADGNKLITNNTILEPDQNNIEFSFLTTTFKYQKDLSYKYQLKGYEKKPVRAKTEQHFATYPNLPAGTYTFEVNSFIKNRKNESATLTFTIQSYWYKTPWFKVLVVFSALFALYYIYKVRVNTILQRRDKEVMQKRLAESSLTSLKAQMNPHFLFNAMNSIQALILKKQNKEAYEYLTELSELVRENLKMSDVGFVHFSDELNLIKKYLELEKLRFKETFSYQVENLIQSQEFYIPSMLIQPFIENGIKHGLLHKKTDRFLSIKFIENNKKSILCIITDNGIGRIASNKLNENRAYKSFSTSTIEKRFAILKEYFNLDINFSYEDLYENDKALGTRVTIKLPFTNDRDEQV